MIDGDFIDERDDLDAGAIGKARRRRSNEGGGGQAPPSGEASASVTAAALAVIPSDDYWVWLRVGGALRRELGDEEGFKLFAAWSAKSKKYDERECAQKWEECAKVTAYTVGTIYYYADQADPGWRKRYDSSDTPEFSEINDSYALVLAGNKAAVMKFEDESKFRLIQVGAFQQWFANRRVATATSRKPLTVAEYWLAHPQRRQYEGIEFAPSGRQQSGYYNLWRGFAVEPREGDCSLFLAHLRDNVAQHIEHLYQWVVAWFAQIVQRPDQKLDTSLVLRGKPGVGKTIVGEIIGSLLGKNHYDLVAEPRYVTGQFNSHMASLLLLHADEAFWAGNKSAEGKLRDIVSGKHHHLEYKTIDPIIVQNYMRLFVTGQHDWVVPATLAERRFAVLDVGEDHKQDLPYFAAIIDEMNCGGREALLHHLLKFDLSQVNLRIIPRTTALFEQQIQSATPEQAWWYDTLQSGRLPWGTTEAGTCPKVRLFLSYIRHASRQGVRRKAIETSLGMFLKRYVGPNLRSDERLEYTTIMSHGVPVTNRGRCYRFPPLDECRKRFAQVMQQTIAWSEEAGWCHEDEQVYGDLPMFD